MFIVLGPPAFVIISLVVYVLYRVIAASGHEPEPEPFSPGDVGYRPDTVGWHTDPLGHYPQRWWDGAV